VRVFIDDTGTQRYVRDVRGRFAKMAAVMEERLKPMFREAIVKQFESEGAWGGDPWTALSDETIKRKTLSGTLDEGILRDSMRLFEAFAEPDSPDFDVEIKGNTFSYVIRVPYAWRHQDGSDRLPVREIVPDPMPESFIEQMRNVVSGYILEAELVEED